MTPNFRVKVSTFSSYKSDSRSVEDHHIGSQNCQFIIIQCRPARTHTNQKVAQYKEANHELLSANTHGFIRSAREL